MKRSHALMLRDMMHKAAVSLTDEDALEAVELFPLWQPDTEYERGIRVRYNEKLYRCEQTHTSQAIYPPDIVPALWTEVAPPGEIPVWKQPTGAQDAYMKGDRVWYPEKDTDVWVSTEEYNIWAPGVHGWAKEE